jgi:predicted small secreted protein
MKKVFVVLFASAAFSFAACNSGGGEGETMDSTEVSDMVNEAMDSVKNMVSDVVDSAAANVSEAVDSAMAK